MGSPVLADRGSGCDPRITRTWHQLHRTTRTWCFQIFCDFLKHFKMAPSVTESSVGNMKKVTSQIGWELEELMKKRIVVIDGAMGTMVQRHKLEEPDFRTPALANHTKPLKGNNDLLSLSRPDIIYDIHKQYFEAGADIVETNTFSGTWVAQADYGLESLVYDINYQGAKLARAAADDVFKATGEKRAGSRTTWEP